MFRLHQRLPRHRQRDGDLDRHRGTGSADERALQDERASRIAASLGTWVAIASFAGATGGGYTECAGCSGLWSPDGNAVAQVGEDPGEIASARLA